MKKRHFDAPHGQSDLLPNTINRYIGLLRKVYKFRAKGIYLSTGTYIPIAARHKSPLRSEGMDRVIWIVLCLCTQKEMLLCMNTAVVDAIMVTHRSNSRKYTPFCRCYFFPIRGNQRSMLTASEFSVSGRALPLRLKVQSI